MPSTNGVTTKSVYDKSIGNYELTPHENYDDINEFPERDTNNSSSKKRTNFPLLNPKLARNDNKRSVSLDAFAKRKTFMEQSKPNSAINPNSSIDNRALGSFNKENSNNDSMDKKDPRKLVPRLKLEMIPNYHAKFNQAANQNPTVPPPNKTYTQQVIQNPPLGVHNYSQSSFEMMGGTGTSSSLAKYIKK